MKFSYLVLLLLLFTGCDQSTITKEVDNRPATELALIKKLKAADSVFNISSNEIKKAEALEKGKTEIAKFILDSLQVVKLWPAIVKEINVDISYVDVVLLISKGTKLDEKYPQYNAIVLNSKVDLSDTTIKNSLKEFYNGDTVLVSGTFEKDVVGKIDFSDNFDSPHERTIFSNPAFKFHIESIVKKGK